MLSSVPEMEGIYATGGHSLFDHESLAEFKYLAFPHYCVLLDCESLIHVDFIPLFVIHVWHPRFPLSGIKKYST